MSSWSSSFSWIRGRPWSSWSSPPFVLFVSLRVIQILLCLYPISLFLYYLTNNPPSEVDGGYFFDLTPSKISETGGGIGWVPIILSAASIPAFIFGIINEYFALVRFSRPAILLLGLVDLGLFVITMVLGVLGSVQTKEIDCGWMNLDRTVGGVAEVVLFDGSERLRCEAWRGINGVTVSLSTTLLLTGLILSKVWSDTYWELDFDEETGDKGRVWDLWEKSGRT